MKFDRKCFIFLQFDWSKLVELGRDWLTYVKFLVFNILDINLTSRCLTLQISHLQFDWSKSFDWLRHVTFLELYSLGMGVLLELVYKGQIKSKSRLASRRFSQKNEWTNLICLP